jgi:hypothetical protein
MSTLYKLTKEGRVPLTEEELQEYHAKNAEWAAGSDARAAEKARTKRDALLAECDWVTVKAVDQNAQDSLGIQVPQVWLTYRQALRDITSHANFPNLTETDWPTKPE